MTTYPVRAGDAVDFTPDSLKSLASPPVFSLRWATRDDKRLADIVAARSGVVRHTTRELRAEVLDTARRNMSAEDFLKTDGVLREYWKAADEYAEAAAKYEGDEPFPDFEHPDKDAEVDLWERCQENSARLRVMISQNENYLQGLCETWFRVLCSGWAVLPTAYRRIDGAIPADDLDVILSDLVDLVEGDEDLAGKALAEIFVKAFSLRSLEDARRKNSQSLPSSSETPSPIDQSQDTAATNENGSSPASKASSGAITPDT